MTMKTLLPIVSCFKTNFLFALLLTLFAARQAHAQCTSAPSIAYLGVNAVYLTGTAITPLMPTVSGGTPATNGDFYVSTFSGTGSIGSNDGGFTTTEFNNPDDVAVDNAGNLYVADAFNHRIRKIDINTGIASIFAGRTAGFGGGEGTLAQFNYPTGITIDNMGNLYVADYGNHSIRKIVIATGEVTTLAGSGASGFVNGTGTAAQFNNPRKLTIDNAGNLYVTDTGNDCIRKIVIATGTVTTLAGSGAPGFANGTGTAAQFGSPSGIVADNTGNLYVADAVNYRIRKIVIATGVVTTFAGSTQGFSNGTGTVAQFNIPSGITIDNMGNLYVADYGNHSIRKIVIATGAVTTVAGSTFGYADGTGTTAQFKTPTGITVDNIGNLYLSDRENQRIRKVIPQIYTIAPALPAGLVFDLATGRISGTPTTAAAATSYTIATQNGCGSNSVTLIFAVCVPPKIISSSAPVNTCIGTNVDLTVVASGAGLSYQWQKNGVNIAGETNEDLALTGVTVSSAGAYACVVTGACGVATTIPTTLTVAPSAPSITYSGVNAVYPTGTTIATLTPTVTGGTPTPNSGFYVSTLAGAVNGFADGTGAAAKFNQPNSMVLDNAGNMYVTDRANHCIRKIVIATGLVTTLAGSTSGFSDGTGTAAKFASPIGISLDNTGNLYVADGGNHRIRKVVIATGVVTTVAGSTQGFADGTGASARFYFPSGMTTDNRGNLYVADYANNRIRKITIATGAVTTLAGGGLGFADGIGTAAQFSGTNFIAIDNADNLYVTDDNNNCIRKIIIATGAVTTVAGGIQGFADGMGTAAKFNGPTGIATDNLGNLYLSDRGNHRIRKIVIATGGVTTLAGSGTPGFADGTSVTAQFNSPYGIMFDNIGNLYVNDGNNNRIRKLTPQLYNIAPALPAGLVFDEITGTISGTPTVATASTSYTVTTQNACGSTTKTLVFTVCSQLIIVTQPSPVSTCAGSSASFTVVASGSGLAYQWQRNGVNIAGATGAVLSLTGVTASNAGAYVCVVSGGTCGAVNTIPATLAVAAGVPSITYSGVSSTYTPGAAITPIVPTVNSEIPTGSGRFVVATLAGYTQGFFDGGGAAAQFDSPSSAVADNAGNVYIADTNNNKIRKISSVGVVTTVAGSTQGFADGIGTAAQFNTPTGITIDNAGNLYVADAGSNRIRKVVIATGAVTTLAGSGTLGGFTDGIGTAAQFYIPTGITTDNSGNLYVADLGNFCIRKVTISTGEVTTFAGTSMQGFTDAIGTAARFDAPFGIVADKIGNLYVTDQNNHRIRKIIIATGAVTTLAGSTQGFVNGTGAAAQFNQPLGATTDNAGNLYIADAGNNRIRKIVIATGVVTTVAGASTTGGTDGAGTAARFSFPTGIAADNAGNIYVTDQNNHRVRTLTHSIYSLTPALSAGLDFDAVTGIISGTPAAAVANTTYTVTTQNACGSTSTTLAFTVCTPPIITTQPAAVVVCVGGTAAFSVVATGAVSYQWQKNGVNITGATSASLSLTGVTAANNGSYACAITNSCNVTTSSAVTLTAITAPSIAYTGVSAVYPTATAIAPLSPTVTGGTPTFSSATVSTLAGVGGTNGFINAMGTAAQFNQPYGVGKDNLGNLYVADQENHSIRKIVIATGVVTTVAGSGTNGFANGTGAAAQFDSPRGVAADNAGNLYVADVVNNRIRKIVIATGVVTTLAGSSAYGSTNGVGAAAAFNFPTGIAADNAGNLYIADQNNHSIRKIVIATGVVTTLAGYGVQGFVDGTGTAAEFNTPTGVATDNLGNLYVADGGNNSIRKIVIATGVVTTLAGSGTQGSADGVGTAAQFFGVGGITADNAGNLYIADSYNNKIRKISTSTSVVTTLAGSGADGYADGVGTAAQFSYPTGVTVDNTGNLYVADYFNATIRKIIPNSFSIAPALPTGLLLNTTAGIISGTPTTTTANTTYTVTTQNACGSTSTTLAFATSCVGAVITTQPVAVTTCSSTTATFTIVASGSGLSYQWQKNSVNIVGATNASLVLTNVTTTNAGAYRCVVTSTCGAATSNAVNLTVNNCTGVIYSGTPTCQSYLINNVSGTSFYNIYGNNGIIASIRPNQNLGDVTVTVGDPAGTSTYDSKQFLGRNINFTSTIAPTTNYDMRLYYFDSELDAYKTAINMPSATIADLNMAWASGGTGCDLATYAGSATSNGTIDKASVSEIDFGQVSGSNLDGFYLQFSLNHFTMFAPTIIAAGALPVKMLYFTGKTVDKTNVLSWATTTEQNNYGFEVERSTDGVSFSSIGFVRGAGNSTTQKEYTFTDGSATICCGSSKTTICCGSTYYRLKQIDTDNRYEYSNIISLGARTATTLAIYPNPSTGIFTLTGNGDSKQTATATLTNGIGQNYIINVINNQIDLTDFPTGVYFLQLLNDGEPQVIKLVKL